MGNNSTEHRTLKSGDWIKVEGRLALVVHKPQVVVLYEDLGIHIVPVGAVERSERAPEIKYEDFCRARKRWPEPTS